MQSIEKVDNKAVGTNKIKGHYYTFHLEGGNIYKTSWSTNLPGKIFNIAPANKEARLSVQPGLRMMLVWPIPTNHEQS